ncbi:MAG: Maltose-binding periplasmic protein precursor [Microgenomates bacterium OLB22]|nr:MAG: Maltose-binding periplasmic protein precursor [Microgenomates bacterium OLB22]
MEDSHVENEPAQGLQPPSPAQTEPPVDSNTVLESSSPEHPDSIVAPYEKKPGGIPKILIFLGIGVVFLCLVGLIFTVLTRVGKKKEITLTYWGLWEDTSVMNSVIADYKKVNPAVTIRYEQQSPGQYREKLQFRIPKGEGPDIFRFHATWAPMLQEVLVPAPDKIINQQQFETLYYPFMKKDLVYDKKIIGLPFGMDMLVLIYNPELLSRLGFESPPKTWEELLSTAKEVTVKKQEGALVTSGVALGTAENIEHFSEILGWMLLQNGASLYDLTSNEAVEVLQSYRSFAEDPLRIWDESMPNDIQAFAQGKVAIIFAPTWEIFTIRSINPGAQLAVSTLPLLPGESQSTTISTYWADGVSRSSSHQEEAWKFLKFLSEKETQAKLFEQQSKMRMFGSAYPRRDMADLVRSNQFLAPLADQAGQAESYPLASRTADNGLNDEIRAYLKDAVNATIKGTSYRAAFETAASGVQQIIKKYKITVQ